MRGVKGTFKDLAGLRFGLLIVKGLADSKKGKTRWLVHCDCGVQKIIRGDGLESGRTKSCGCARDRFKRARFEKRFGLVNQRFGKLLVLWRTESNNLSRKGRGAVWECKCDCGNVVKVEAKNLRTGKTQSCGCLLKELWLPKGQAVRSVVLQRYRKDANRLERTWELSDTRFDELVSGNCYYCGDAPYRQVRHKERNASLVCNGIDRLDNRVGYVEGNVVPCCYTCNLMKRTLSPEAFIAHIRRILNRWTSKNMEEAKAQ